ncbi:hypothetical protein DUNSADRAFT_15436 [Dunaliella salina]|uniref:Encoded protein n=1 Tax=Dunaliella salina TaxID=3046 RepID=A0ABQ7G5E4_DUNSA|nr:hypothetical protein DUNSADRAFT_15436 [Dunaliella salina]|eukprot:KAF5829836.1 hypothetical protein DUNSADRAFT_15436 [Dunaliella salina]
MLSLSFSIPSHPAATTSTSNCRERRLRHSAARALRTSASVLPTHTHPSPQNPTTHTATAAQEEVAPQPAFAAPRHWSSDGPNHVAGKHAISSNTTSFKSGTLPQFEANREAQPPDSSKQQASPVLWMPDDLLMGVLQPQQDLNRGNRKWPYIRVRPTQAIGSQAGFANKMLRMRGRVLMECSGDEGIFTAIRVLRCTRSMLQVDGCIL